MNLEYLNVLNYYSESKALLASLQCICHMTKAVQTVIGSITIVV